MCKYYGLFFCGLCGFVFARFIRKRGKTQRCPTSIYNSSNFDNIPSFLVRVVSTCRQLTSIDFERLIWFRACVGEWLGLPSGCGCWLCAKVQRWKLLADFFQIKPFRRSSNSSNQASQRHTGDWTAASLSNYGSVQVLVLHSSKK